jgi:hypothetical protein
MRNMPWWVERLTAIRSQGAERFHVPAGRTPPEPAGMRYLLSLILLDLLCHLLIFLSLYFPYTETYDPYEQATFRATGWQMLGGGFQLAMLWPTREAVAIVLLAALILPVFPNLSCLLLFPLKSEWKDVLLGKGFYLNCLLNTVGFALSSSALTLSLLFLGADFNKETHRIDTAFGILPAAFLLSLVCSCVLLGHFLQRTGGALRIRGSVEGETQIEATSEKGRASKSPGLPSSTGGEEFQRETIPTRFSRDRKRLVFVLGALLGLITLMETSWLVVDLSLSGFLGPNGGRSVWIGWDLSRGEEYPFDVYVENVSDKTIMLHPITFPLGFSASLQLRREVVTSVNPVDNPFHETKVGTTPVEGYHLGPHMGVLMTLIFVARAQGTYTIGPVTAHAAVPFLFTTVQVSNTYTHYALLCVEVDAGMCRQSLQEISG